MSGQGRGGGLVVSVLAFNSYNLSSNLAGYFSFLYEKTKINKKGAGVGPPLKNNVRAAVEHRPCNREVAGLNPAQLLSILDLSFSTLNYFDPR